MEGVVIDTNVFVAAGFDPRSASARILEGVREGRFRLIWNQPTRSETEMILRRIPRLDWQKIADPDDRKFAALSAAANVPLVTSDKLVLAQRGRIGIEISALLASLAVGDLPKLRLALDAVSQSGGRRCHRRSSRHRERSQGKPRHQRDGYSRERCQGRGTHCHW